VSGKRSQHVKVITYYEYRHSNITVDGSVNVNANVRNYVPCTLACVADEQCSRSTHNLRTSPSTEPEQWRASTKALTNKYS